MKRNKEMSFEATDEDYEAVARVVNRAYELGLTHSKLDLNMDLIATNANGCPLDFEKLLGFDNFNFGHDILGITSYIDRTTRKLGGCFLPRCAR